MAFYPQPLEHLIELFSRLPGIGQKSAARMALYILKDDRDLARDLAHALLEVKDRIRFCSVCFNLTEDDPCAICTDESRKNGAICVVEGPGDQLALEESGCFKGRYHVLHGALSPLDHTGPEDLKISELISRLEPEGVKEIILATNPTTEGEATASFLRDILSNKGLEITRIALGVPVGGDLKYMDRMTLQHALKSRMKVEA
jgi:recombination protein RecR